MITNATHLENINSPLRSFTAGIVHYGYVSTAMAGRYTSDGALQEFTVERIGKDKFFGFGICQKLIFKIQDNKRQAPTNYGNFQVGINNLYPFPVFMLDEATRDEKTNQLTYTAYDYIYKANGITVSQLNLTTPYTLEQFVAAAASAISGGSGFGVGYELQVNDDSFSLEYPDGANFDGTESLRSALDAVAEATQTIYFMNSKNKLVFKRLDKSGAAVYTIDKSKYFELDNKSILTLNTVVSATALGDNLSASTGSGITQYVRDNPFWTLREDITELVDKAAAAVCGLKIAQFTCSWRGNYLLEPGDKIDLITKNDSTITSYILSDTITYNGGLKETSSWQFEDDSNTSTPANPTTIGEAVKQTYAKVDKINQEIDLVASKVDANSSQIAALEINTDSIGASVESIQRNLEDSMNGVSTEIEELRKKVELQLTEEDLTIKIQEQINSGVSSVETTTGFKFNEDGLTISKSDSDVSTQIDEDGMTVSKGGEELLVADSVGVKAKNLHATTYLIIGKYSRFEDYTNADGEARTGCFWIGG